MKRTLFCVVAAMAMAGIGFAAEADWPGKVRRGGTDVTAILAPWVVESPAEYAGHYVNASITDGWEDLRLKVLPPGKGRGDHWTVQTYKREAWAWADAREKDIDYPSSPLTPGDHAFYVVGPKATRMFFVRYRQSDSKDPTLHKALIGSNGEVFEFEPNVPKTVLVAGRETTLAFSPWKAPDPSQYAGRYVSVSEEKGGAELELAIKRMPKSRVPWRFEMAHEIKPSVHSDDNYSYSRRPLWQEKWPHFDAHRTWLFVLAPDPRKAGSPPQPAVVSEQGELFLKEKNAPK